MTFVNDLHSQKTQFPNIVSEAGSVISFSDVHLSNDESSILVTFGGIEKFRKLLQLQKAYEPIYVTSS